ncbi:hypothetical protein [Leptolyngbya sp. FACHB-261]|uniref:hypothetical protein n=1 Tax=Leptolyngbya sp. FACHB-261 TaxID=2692806 RepID=UPI00168A073A|nr:hypothetical protein [Leptolyngbya sp. FACHB-261]MBD2100753.1 hypothetical protein [Leptolyngbya sp. FACHB-261]
MVRGLKQLGLALMVGLVAGLASVLVLLSPAGADVSAPGLAEHLSQVGARMYGAYWCSHCAEQKQTFGAAFAQVPYVECDPQGAQAQTQLCRDKGIQGFPTWEIEGQLYPGTRSLEELVALSHYNDFKSSF